MSKLNKQLLIAFISILIFIFISVIFSSLFIPHNFKMATGDINGNYHKMVLLYKKELLKKGIDLELVNTKGSIENLDLLNNNQVDIAFLQNNIVDKSNSYENIKGVASLYNEPIFVFYRKSLNINLLSEIKNKRVSLGSQGSGTYFLSKKILEINGINEKDIKPEYLSSFNASRKLIENKIDVAFIVMSLDSNIIKDLISNKDISLFSFDNYEAYKYHSFSLNNIKIPQGYYDIGKNIPSREIILLSSLATIASQENIPPRIIETLLITIKEITQEQYNQSLSFENSEFSFPSDKYLDFEIHSASELFFKEGPSFLTQYFSYTVALLLSRLKYFLIPLIPFIIIFIRVIPGIYDFRLGLIMKKKYKELGDIEKAILNSKTQEDFEKLLKRVEDLKRDMDITSQKIPAQYQRNIYDWKMHISLIEDVINNKKSLIV
ncbi:MAG: TAXI family TRAP transporter solute-binding subunit [Candidatus Sericytochromatia bacterium]